MYLRKERIPQAGLSNLDYRTKDQNQIDFKVTQNHTIDALSVPRKKNFLELLKQKIMKTVPAPLDETKKFYEETGKEIKQKTDVSHKRSSQLEEKEKRKRVFTGDSNVIFNEKIYQAYPNISDYEQIKKLLPGLAKEKHELHAKAIQETQLIGLEGYITETLEGKVNLEKIKEVRRAIRRRYANRKNFKKIFSAWDEDSQGSLSIKNVYNMVKKMGLNINAYEAQVLVASADRNGNGHLSLDEFLDLIFNDNTMLNIDLKKIPLKEDEEFKQEKSDEVLKYLTHDANESRIKKHQNQIQLVLQNQINAITNYCIELDEKKFGYINKEKFQKLLGKINISENILTNEDRNVLYEQYKDDKNNFNYKNFVSQIKNFTFNVDEAYNEAVQKQVITDKNNLEKRFYDYENKKFEDEEKILRVCDIKTLSFNQLENVRLKFKKVFRVLNSYFPKREDIDEFLKKQLHLDHEEYSQVSLSQKNLCKIFQGFFLNIEDKVNKKDLEGFLSVLNYNEYGFAKANNISNTIYNEDDDKFFMRVANKIKGPEPPEFKTKIGNFVEEENILIDKTKSKNLIRSQSALPYSKKPLNQILEKIDSHVFMGRLRAYEAFKSFDKDKDGYVTKDDLFKKFQELNILNRNEFDTFMEYVDPQNKGFLNFSEFSKKVKPNMGKTDEMGNFLNPPNVLPAKTINENFIKNLDNVKAKINQIYLPYRPESHTLVRNTRIGNTPAWKNTFVNFQAQKDSALHVTEEERFHLDKVKFLKDENMKKLNYDNAKMEKIKNYQDQILTKINLNYEKKEENEKFKLKQKGANQWAYEHRCRLRNEII